MAKLTGLGKTAAVSGAVLAGATIIGGIVATKSSPPAVARSVAARYCATTAGECRPLSTWEMMGLTECPSGWHEVPSCSNSGTVEVTPEPTLPPEPSPAPTPTVTPPPPTATPTTPPAPSCEPIRIVRWANVSPEPVGVTLTAQAGDRGGELWTPTGKRALLPRERVQITAAGGIAIGAGLVELRGSAVQVVGDREVPSTLPGELLWPCEAR